MLAREVAVAVAALASGRLVAFPTETVFGLAVSARSDAGLAALRRWKGREAAQPVSLLVSGPAAAEAAGVALSEPAQRLAARFWPGPLTLVVPCGTRFPAGVARADGAVGLRCSSHPAAAALARAAEAAGLGPLTATSLNRSGEPPAADEAAARALCSTGADAPQLFAPAGFDAYGDAPTTVLDLTSSPPRVLRAGGLDAEVLRACAEEISGAAAPVCSTPAARTPRGDSRA